ncbi:MAG: hypothetical protein P4M02_03895, partial [Clostridia bacterium]|nr:hypothetical protein [Clostridia bacterium]
KNAWVCSLSGLNVLESIKSEKCPCIYISQIAKYHKEISEKSYQKYTMFSNYLCLLFLMVINLIRHIKALIIVA